LQSNYNQSYTIDDLFKINNLVEYISVRSNLYFILDIGEDEKIEPWEVWKMRDISDILLIKFRLN
jgi:hypothetical protein